VTQERTDGWSYAGITFYQLAGIDPLAVDVVDAIQQRAAGGGGNYLHRRVTLTGENRIGPAEGGSRDHRELEGDPVFEQAGVVTDHRDGPLTKTTGVVMAEAGFQVEAPRWYWEPIEHAPAADPLGAAG
jgi:hypothetical protein